MSQTLITGYTQVSDQFVTRIFADGKLKGDIVLTKTFHISRMYDDFVSVKCQHKKVESVQKDVSQLLEVHLFCFCSQSKVVF